MKKRSNVADPLQVTPSSTLLDLTDAVCERYADDPSAPSIVLSKLGPTRFYAAIVRYKQRFGEQKYNVCKAEGVTQYESIHLLAKEWAALAQDIIPRPAYVPHDPLPISAAEAALRRKP